MEVILTIISVVSLLYKVISSISEASDSGSSHRHVDTSNHYLDNYEFSEEEKLDNMSIDNLVVCYNSAIASNHSIKSAVQSLTYNIHQSDLVIKDIIVRRNCIYVKVMHAIPFSEWNKCYGAAFSINYMEPNNSFSVYGMDKINKEEVAAFKAISTELLAALSR